MKEYQGLKRIGVEPFRSYYVPFDEQDKVKTVYGIVDRRSSSRFLSLDGLWQIKRHESVDGFALEESLDGEIPVPSCVQMHGYGQIQYINSRYPFPFAPPYVPKENPCWHYRKKFSLDKKSGEKYYLNFEGVDSAFYLYVNGVKKGYSQISHAVSEFDVTDLLKKGENVLDVLVLKWCASSYLECQDKFRFSGIFRNVYLLKRPLRHLTDYKIQAEWLDGKGVFTFKSESKVDATLYLLKKKIFVPAGKSVRVEFDKILPWSPENPTLYTLEIHSQGEKIVEKVGFRSVTIEEGVFKVNGKAVKLKGVNRHDFNPKTAATVTLKNQLDDLKLMKKMSVNAVRTSHYPTAPEFYLLCDALGLYVMDEADLETHGATAIQGGYDVKLWQQFAEDEFWSDGIFDRHRALVERDKNRPSVVIWSLGNESSFGKAFFKGAKYIKKRDDRPVHYEGLQNADKKYYYTKYVDMVSMMYPTVEWIEKRYVQDKKETRPFVLCEYSHAMGNSNGELADYWSLICSSPRMMGGFVWEWADHAVWTKKGLLYGGDFGETEHDGNFCVDGIVTADRKIKSGTLEMKAVYDGILESENNAEIPAYTPCSNPVKVQIDEQDATLCSLQIAGKELLKEKVKLNVLRAYTDNDMNVKNEWIKCGLDRSGQFIVQSEKAGNTTRFKGLICANCLQPSVTFELSYTVYEKRMDVTLSYEIAPYVKSLPRIGLEFVLDKKDAEFSFVGYGPHESYKDKRLSAKNGYYESSAEKNYYPYVKPQETGSHYGTTFLAIKDVMTVTSLQPFSFSILPYTTKELLNAKHDFELKKSEKTVVNLDLFMRGIGTNSCGPFLGEEHEIPRTGTNTFTIEF